MDGKAWLDSLLGEELTCIRIRVRESDVVFIKGILEASEGLAALFAEPRGSPSDRRDGGEVVIAAPHSRRDELTTTLADLWSEIGFVWSDGRASPDVGRQ